METYLPSFPGAYLVWQSIVETDDCHLEMIATCNGVNCLNKNINFIYSMLRKVGNVPIK